MSIDVSKIIDFLNSLYGVPRVALVFFFCMFLSLILHMVIKRLPWIPNYAIPIVIPCLVPFAGSFLLIGCSQWEKSKIPTVYQFITINLMIGYITGVVAMLVYGVAVLKVLRKFKVTNGDTAFIVGSKDAGSKLPAPPVDSTTE